MRKDPRLLTQAALVAKDQGRFREYHTPRSVPAGPKRETSRIPRWSGRSWPARAWTRAQSDELRERLDADSRAAIERGVFGAPTLFVGDEMFWGNDRFELVRHYILKSRS